MGLEDIVRIGIVSDIDAGKRLARVHFPALDVPSDWLMVLQHPQAKLSIQPDGEHDHAVTGSGLSLTAGAVPDHSHPDSTLGFWMPKVGDKVLVLYIPVHEGDGFILGGF